MGRALRIVIRSCALALAVSAAGCGHREGGAAAPGSIGEIVPTRLVDQDGHAFGAEQLHGHVWLVALMFTHCPMACPAMAERMSYIQTLLPRHAADIRMLSVSVDPEDDTPPVLTAYGQRFHRDPAIWTFVTGQTEPTLRSVTDGFAKDRPGHAFDHGSTFALADEQGRIRGYYGMDDTAVASLLDDADRVAVGH
jgi:protein SCO1/2